MKLYFGAHISIEKHFEVEASSVDEHTNDSFKGCPDFIRQKLWLPNMSFLGRCTEVFLIITVSVGGGR